MALDFDGAADFLEWPSSTLNASITALTASFWSNPKTLEANKTFLHKAQFAAGNPTAGFAIAANNTTSTMAFLCSTGGTNQIARLASSLTADTWDHWVWVYNGGGAANADRLKLYKNGVAQTLAFVNTIPTSVGNPTNTLIAARTRTTANALSTFYQLQLEGLKVWTAALSAEEAAQEVYTLRPIRTDNLVIWCPCIDATSAVDFSGNENTPTVTGTASVLGGSAGYGAN